MFIFQFAIINLQLCFNDLKILILKIKNLQNMFYFKNLFLYFLTCFFLFSIYLQSCNKKLNNQLEGKIISILFFFKRLLFIN